MYTLVTGATGFIGQRLVSMLMQEKRKVKCLVRDNSNIEKLKKYNVNLVFGDVENLDSVIGAMEDVDVVYHLAAVAKPSNYKPYSDYKVNVIGTKNILEAASRKKEGIKKLVFMSSIAATGPSRDGKLLDENSSYRPITNYGISKVEVEKCVHLYEEKYALPCVIIRPPMVYGIGDKDWIGFFEMIKCAGEKGKKLFVPGEHKNLFDFCYVDNLVEGMIKAEKAIETIGETYFLSDDHPYTISEILDAVSEAYHVKIPCKYYSKNLMFLLGYMFDFLGKIFHFDGPISKRDVMWMTQNYWVVSCDKAKKQFHYAPQITLKEGIARTIKWQQKERE